MSCGNTPEDLSHAGRAASTLPPCTYSGRPSVLRASFQPYQPAACNLTMAAMQIISVSESVKFPMILMWDLAKAAKHRPQLVPGASRAGMGPSQAREGLAAAHCHAAGCRVHCCGAIPHNAGPFERPIAVLRADVAKLADANTVYAY